MRKPLAAIAIAALAAAHTGCGNACDDAVDHAEECQVEIEATLLDTDECSDRDACIADCIVAASCETLQRQDMQGAQDFAVCVNEC